MDTPGPRHDPTPVDTAVTAVSCDAGWRATTGTRRCSSAGRSGHLRTGLRTRCAEGARAWVRRER
ncbi:hypothetical protein [Ornithinimicrobium kibberense]|uniref:hypothetical protein n=1 Tax=Ornithinimicrobium kibberense TaxID=282060 RepID=UPI00360C25AE